MKKAQPDRLRRTAIYKSFVKKQPEHVKKSLYQQRIHTLKTQILVLEDDMAKCNHSNKHKQKEIEDLSADVSKLLDRNRAMRRRNEALEALTRDDEGEGGLGW